MSDDRFKVEEPDDEPVQPHQIRMAAIVLLLWDTDTGRWELAEPAALERDDELMVCTDGLHLDSRLARDRCDVQKERARAAPVPSRRAVADAFARAADNPPRLFRPVQGN